MSLYTVRSDPKGLLDFKKGQPCNDADIALTASNVVQHSTVREAFNDATGPLHVVDTADGTIYRVEPGVQLVELTATEIDDLENQ